MSGRHLVSVWPSQIQVGDRWTVVHRTSHQHSLKRISVCVTKVEIDDDTVFVTTDENGGTRQHFARGRRLMVQRLTN